MGDQGLGGRVRSWWASGAVERIRGREIFVRRAEGEDPLLLFLHGFPSSSFDWRETIAAREGRATMTLDLLGFGLSEKPRDARYSLLEQPTWWKRRWAGSARGRCCWSLTTWGRRSGPSCSRATSSVGWA